MVHIASAISLILWFILNVQEWAISVTCMTFPKLPPWLTIVPAVKNDYAYTLQRKRFHRNLSMLKNQLVSTLVLMICKITAT